jgi:AcrR family transcriptional regulator
MMSVLERRARERVEVRELILDAARELFVELGYEGVSMRKVAQRIDYSPTAIYLHFADKEALFHELCRQDFGQLAAAFLKLSAIADPAERLAACGHAYVEFAVAHPNHYRLMFMTPVNLPLTESEKERRGNPDEDAYAFVRSIVAECMQAGLFAPELTDADLIAQTLWAGVHGVAALEITTCKGGWTDWCSLEDRIDFMLRSLLHGMVRHEDRAGQNPTKGPTDTARAAARSRKVK